MDRITKEVLLYLIFVIFFAKNLAKKIVIKKEIKPTTRMVDKIINKFEKDKLGINSFIATDTPVLAFPTE